jgi:hypothetical protein
MKSENRNKALTKLLETSRILYLFAVAGRISLYRSNLFSVPAILSRYSQYGACLDYIFRPFIDAYFLLCRQEDQGQVVVVFYVFFVPHLPRNLVLAGDGICLQLVVKAVIKSSISKINQKSIHS